MDHSEIITNSTRLVAAATADLELGHTTAVTDTLRDLRDMLNTEMPFARTPDTTIKVLAADILQNPDAGLSAWTRARVEQIRDLASAPPTSLAETPPEKPKQDGVPATAT